MQRGEEPGTVTIIEPEWPAGGEPDFEDLVIAPHDLDPAKVLRLVRALSGNCQRLLLVACEPATFGDEEEGLMGLSPPVAAAVVTITRSRRASATGCSSMSASP